MKTIRPVIGMLVATASTMALAQQHAVRIGAAHIDIDSKSPDFTSNGPGFLTPQPSGLVVDDATTLLFTYARRLDDRWEIEFAAGLPPPHDVVGRDRIAPFGVIARVRQASPTLFMNYRLGVPQDALRPFVGIGINYTRFFDARSSEAGNLASGGPTKISLTESVGPAFQAGASYRLTDRWSVTGAVTIVDVRSKLIATTGSIRRRTTINYRPTVYTLCVGYHF
jgi:outer membrane protein